MQVDQLMIEITRRCNMKCRHCLRGPAQKKDFPSGLFEKFIKKNHIDSVNNFMLTGGEPFLNPSMIKEIIDAIIKNKIYIETFYIATNGTVFDLDLIKYFAKLFSYMKISPRDQNLYEDGIKRFWIEISTDIYHENRKINPIFYLINADERKIPESRLLVNEGRAKNLGIEGWEPRNEEIIFTHDGKNIMEGMLYINCNGDLLCGCDYSYKSQKEHKICYCLDDKIKNIFKNNKREML